MAHRGASELHLGKLFLYSGCILDLQSSLFTKRSQSQTSELRHVGQFSSFDAQSVHTRGTAPPAVRQHAVARVATAPNQMQQPRARPNTTGGRAGPGPVPWD